MEAEPAAQYFDATGAALAIGSTFRNPSLAALLERIAADGPESFYNGPFAQKIVTALNGAQASQSAMTLADLSGYEAKERPPVCALYRAHRICSMGPPSSGGITVLMILKQLERFDMKALGRASPVAWHLLARSSGSLMPTATSISATRISWTCRSRVCSIRPIWRRAQR